jgi:hypothetical protein
MHCRLYSGMRWTVVLHDSFAPEFANWRRDVQAAAIVAIGVLQRIGPTLGRPHADSLYGSKHSNMKELRFSAGDGEWRIAYAFDPVRRAILLVGGSKSGVPHKRFYKRLIVAADARFNAHLDSVRAQSKR